jgi:hypothetical protein
MPHHSEFTDRYRERFAELRLQLQQLSYFCKGTVLERTMKCGQAACACHRDPAKRHGPYWEWTYKQKGKTVNVKLTAAAGPIYKEASRQYRRLKTLLNQLERISHKALAAQAKGGNTGRSI